MVAAFLCVGLVSGWIVGFGAGGMVATIVALVLGALIYRDIIRQEASPPDASARPRIVGDTDLR